MAEERVQKILARAGYGSRRSNEELILAGRVKVNGILAVLGTKADPHHDTITVDNQLIPKEPEPVYIAINKPEGVLSEVSEDETRRTVRDLVPVPGHLFIVGRLDMESEGLILLTNDGELTNQLTHPRYGHEKEYRVLVGTRPDERQMEAWRHGVILEDGYRTAPAQVRIEAPAGRNAWLRVILHEGRKRQIREMGSQIGLPVLRIQRVRIGTLELGDLKTGQWRHLTPAEVRLLKGTSIKKKTRSARPTRSPRGAEVHSKEGTPGSDRSSRSGWTTRTHRPEQAEQSNRPTRSNRLEQREQTNRLPGKPHTGRAGTGDISVRSGRAERPGASDRSGRSQSTERPARTEKPARSKRTVRPGRPKTSR